MIIYNYKWRTLTIGGESKPCSSPTTIQSTRLLFTILLNLLIGPTYSVQRYYSNCGLWNTYKDCYCFYFDFVFLYHTHNLTELQLTKYSAQYYESSFFIPLPLQSMDVKDNKNFMGAVSIKVPPFWQGDPEVWLAQLNSQFVLKNVTNSLTKFNYVVGALGGEIATEVRDLIVSPPTEQPFEKLSEALIRRTTVSDGQKLAELLGMEDLGDRKPSQLLRRFQQLGGPGILEAPITKQLFIQKLPVDVQMILQSCPGDLEQLAEVADKIVEVAPSQVAINSVQRKGESPDLHDRLCRLESRVNAIVDSNFGRPRQRSRTPARFRSNQTKGTLCYYHETWGSKAHKCVQPCSYDVSSKSGN